MLEYIGTGKTVEKAIEDALLNLKAPREDVDIKILETGGLFKKAKVQVTISEDCKEKYEQKQLKRQQLLQEEVEEKKIEQQEQKQEIKQEKKEQKQEAKQEKKQEKQVEKEIKKQEQNEIELGKNFLEGFLKTVNIKGEIEVNETEDEVYYSIKGEDVSQLIGFRGECLNSLQFLTSVVNGKASRKAKKVRLDIDGYRERRKETLTALAHRICKKVEKTGHSSKLEPMSAYERRIIHTVVSENYPDLESVSKGEEPHRYLIVKTK